MEIKVGDYVRCNKTNQEDLRNNWSKEMLPFLDGKTRRVLKVEESKFFGRVLLKLKGIKEGKFGENEDLWNYALDDIEIVDCPLEFGQEVQVRDNKGEYWRKAFFICYVKQSKTPYLTVDDKELLEGFEKGNICTAIVSWKCARTIPEKEYVPYKEPRIDWVKEKREIKEKTTGITCNITGIIIKEENLEVDINDHEDDFTMEELLEDFTWLDGTPCGEENNECKNR